MNPRLDIAARIMAQWAAARVGSAGDWFSLRQNAHDMASIALSVADSLIIQERETRPTCEHRHFRNYSDTTTGTDLHYARECSDCGEKPL